MLNYLSNLKARQTSPLRIRIGGNGMDGSSYDPNFKNQMLEVTDDSFYNAILVKFGPVFFDILNSVADTVGEMEFIVMTSMQNPGDVDTYLPLVKDAKRILGGRLDAVIVGNVSFTRLCKDQVLTSEIPRNRISMPVITLEMATGCLTMCARLLTIRYNSGPMFTFYFSLDT